MHRIACAFASRELQLHLRRDRPNCLRLTSSVCAQAAYCVSAIRTLFASVTESPPCATDGDDSASFTRSATRPKSPLCSRTMRTGRGRFAQWALRNRGQDPRDGNTYKSGSDRPPETTFAFSRPVVRSPSGLEKGASFPGVEPYIWLLVLSRVGSPRGPLRKALTRPYCATFPTIRSTLLRKGYWFRDPRQSWPGLRSR